VIRGTWLERVTGQVRRHEQVLSALANLIPPHTVSRRPIRKVAYVLSNSVPFSTTGYSIRSQGIAKALQQQGLDIICVTRPGYPSQKSHGDTMSGASSTYVYDGVPYHRILEPKDAGLSLLEYASKASTSLQQFLADHNADAVIAASAAFNTGLAALIAARHSGLPFFYEVRGLWEVTKASQKPAFAKTSLYHLRAALETLVCSNADHVFTLNVPLRDELIARGVDTAKISLVPNSIEAIAQPLVRDDRLAVELGLTQDEIVIGYAGTFSDYEGLDDLVRACGILKTRRLPFKLLLVGEERKGPGKLVKTLKDLIAAHGLQGHAIITGKVPHSQVKRYYSLMDITPFPRKPLPVCEMVSPIKPLEAMAYGKAVVVSSVRALAEMVDHDATGLVFDKGSVEALANVIQDLIRNVGLRQRLGLAAQAHVVSQRNWLVTTRAITSTLSRTAPDV
jgi:glycosyltransferase involved in cell wall biosynthesis